MTLRPFELLRRIDRESKSTKLKIDSIRSKNIERTDRLQRLAERQTDAFVELARHYLPELSHRSLADAWTEVRGRIRELLLQKEDRRRTLNASLQETRAQREQLGKDVAGLSEIGERVRDHLRSTPALQN